MLSGAFVRSVHNTHAEDIFSSMLEDIKFGVFAVINMYCCRPR